jgi:hypothetical protein
MPRFLESYIGAHLSLHAKHHAEGEPEFLEAEDARLFPIMGGAMLISLYLVYKFLPKEYVDVRHLSASLYGWLRTSPQIVVNVYFFGVGQVGLAATVKGIMAMILQHSFYDCLDHASTSFCVPMCIARWIFQPEKKVREKSFYRPSLLKKF